MRRGVFSKILLALALATTWPARAEVPIDPKVVSSFDEVTQAVKGGTPKSCDLPTTAPRRPLVQIRSKNPIFNQVPGFAMTLQGDFPTIGVESPGKLEYRTYDGKTVSMPVELHPRGQSRREILCPRFPPFKIVLPKNPPGSVFNKSDRDLKVVTHCVNPPTLQATEVVLQEYTLYRVLEASGMYSFLVQLSDITYKDPQGKIVARAPGFIIENLKDARKRYFKRRVTPVGPRVYITESGARRPYDGEFELSEWLLGNTDYDVIAFGRSHNAYKMRHPSGGSVVMPYDFDLSALIFGRAWDNTTDFDDLSYLSKYGKNSEGRALLKLLIMREAQMLAAIAESPIHDFNKQKFYDRVRTVVSKSREVLK